jgi:hypothetical protein
VFTHTGREYWRAEIEGDRITRSLSHLLCISLPTAHIRGSCDVIIILFLRSLCTTCI